MKQRAFIVKLNIEDGSNPNMIAEDLADIVRDEGYNVLSVAPYAAANTGGLSTFGALSSQIPPAGFEDPITVQGI